MPIFKIIFFWLLLIVNQSVNALDSAEILPPEQAFKMSAEAKSGN